MKKLVKLKVKVVDPVTENTLVFSVEEDVGQVQEVARRRLGVVIDTILSNGMKIPNEYGI